MKIFKHRNFMSLIFSVIVSLPFLSILSRSAYVAVNKNAKDSYSGQAITQMQPVYYETNEVNSVNDLVVGNLYYYTPTNTATTDTFIMCDLVKVQYGFTKGNFTIERDVPYFKIYANNILTLAYESNVDIYEGNTRNCQLYFVFKNATRDLTSVIGNIRQCDLQIVKEYQEVVVDSQTLDNAFDYSLSRFVDEYHWGKLNFFEWFNSLFIDINSNNNTLYLHFINWYMNYFLMVSCAYILFLVLMWFINYSRRLLERGMNYDW